MNLKISYQLNPKSALYDIHAHGTNTHDYYVIKVTNI